jgi:hypothetical protein
MSLNLLTPGFTGQLPNQNFRTIWASMDRYGGSTEQTGGIYAPGSGYGAFPLP